MKHLSLMSLASLAAAGAVGCQTPAATISDTDVATIRGIEQEFVRFNLARATDSIMAQRTADIVWMPPNSPTIEGATAVRQFAQGFPRVLAFAITPVETAGAGTSAFNRGTYTIAFVAGADTTRESGKYIQLWRKAADGSWKIAREIWNADQPAQR